MAIGENGGTIIYGATFPPKAYYQVNVSQKVQDMFFEIKKEYSKKFKQTIWFQPNDVNLTVFPLDTDDIDTIHSFAKQFENSEINIYYHKDSVDFTPRGFDKGTAIDILLEELGVIADKLYVFGDGGNDLPMLVKTKNSFLINSKLDGFEPKEYFDNYDKLEKYLQEFLT
jgi:hydroxymethylpyrimidine pyrophosphatase-like HAD family hydrolase